MPEQLMPEPRREPDRTPQPHADEQSILISRPSELSSAERRRVAAEGESAASASIRRTAVVGIIMIAVIAILGDVLLLWNNHSPPAGLIAIGSAGVGALATLLAVRSR